MFILKKEKKRIAFHERNSNCSENCPKRTKVTLNRIFVTSERFQVNYMAWKKIFKETVCRM